jgi:hypothetical protein
MLISDTYTIKEITKYGIVIQDDDNTPLVFLQYEKHKHFKDYFATYDVIEKLYNIEFEIISYRFVNKTVIKYYTKCILISANDQ